MPPIPSTLSLSYDALLSTSLFNYRKTLADNIAKENMLMFLLQKNGAWREITDIGERAAFPLMYGLGTPDSYDSYDTLDTTPMDGITTAFFDWRQAAVPIAISGKEEKQNRGEAKILDLLRAKITQAEMGIKEWFTKVLFQGNGPNAGAASIVTAWVSPTNASSFVDPIPLIIKYDPTTSTAIGNINQSTHSWWQNQYKASAATTYAGLRQELRTLYNNCSKGSGGKPDAHICDQTTFELYEASLEAMHQNSSYKAADIPFDTIAFRGKPVTWDEQIVDVATPALNTTTKGTWYMFNTQFFGVQVDSTTNFTPTPFQKPENQDAKVAHILFLGALGTNNRRKHGVIGNIARTLS